MVGFGNIFYYFLVLFFAIGLTVISSKILKNKSEKFIFMFIFGVLFSGFVLHFVKLLFDPYASNFPKSLVNISFENISAASTLLYPWLYLSKNKLLRDYMIVLGAISGFGAIIFPYHAVGFNTITFDIARFYYAHYVLFLAPFLMIYTNQHQFNVKNIFKIPFIFYSVLIIILANEIVLIAIGLTPGDINSLLDPSTRNTALIFGPNKQLAKFKWVYSAFVPKIFTKVPFGVHAGTIMYWPIIWLVIPAYFYLGLTGILIDLLIKFFKKSEVKKCSISLSKEVLTQC